MDNHSGGKHELWYSNSPATFQAKTYMLWHRKFTDKAQVEELVRGVAVLVTYMTEVPSPVGGRGRILEQTVMKVRLEVTNSILDDVQTALNCIKVLQPNGFRLVSEDDTFSDDELTLAMWWNPGGQTREILEQPTVARPEVVITTELADVARAFQGGPVWIYGSEVFVVSTSPLGPEQVELLMKYRGDS